ncbi:hypothetical protein C1H46_029660 [Malus baccata]|uniref:Uncharacterized protein n=1 Tax=Malus baccata TaxID=106549 RepID=A0A540LEV0_MALBA|nr:hypothetical protein C1H46_029660 [Malus baccata]
MTVISQLEASSSKQDHIPTSPIIPPWANKFTPSLVIPRWWWKVLVAPSLWKMVLLGFLPTSTPTLIEETKGELHDGVMLLFPQHILVDEFSFAEGKVHARGDSTQEQLKEKKGWTPVLLMRGRSANRGRSLASGDGRSYDNVVRGNKIWVLHSDLVSKWCLMTYGGSNTGIAGGKSGVAEQANESESKCKCVKR